jgi:hypothetical protein
MVFTLGHVGYKSFKKFALPLGLKTPVTKAYSYSAKSLEGSTMDKGVVRPATGLNLREKPNGSKIAVLPAKTEIEILEEVHFLRVKTADGMTGYVHGDYIEELPSGNSSDYDVGLGDTILAEFPSPAFQLVQYQGANFIGKNAMVDKDILPLLKNIDKYAGEGGLNVWGTSSTRNINPQVKGAMVPPASRSCHHIGHAIDMNLQHDGTLYNSKKLRKANLKNLPRPIVDFIQSIRADDNLRWGGDFSTEDPVHIDDNLFNRQEIMYMAKLQSRISQLNA